MANALLLKSQSAQNARSRFPTSPGRSFRLNCQDMSDPAHFDVRKAGRLASHQFSLTEKIAGALADLRLRFFPRRVLAAGPYVGEFGHELMDWQSWVRAQIARHDEVHVITYPGRDYLYPGCRIHYHDVPLEKAGYRFGRLSPHQAEDMARKKAAELGLRNYDLMTARHI